MKNEVPALIHVRRDLVEVALHPADGAQDFLDAINDIRPHVVHFSGHGWSHGLVMDNGSLNSPQGEDLDFGLLAKLLAATTTATAVDH